MNAIIQNLHDRKSVRVFENRPVPEEVRAEVIEAALQAPSAGNQTLYTVLDIDEASVKERLAVLCDNQPFIAQAPLVLVFLADCNRWLGAYRTAGADSRKPLVGDLLLACADALIAAQNSVVAAESLGLGSCYIGDILENMEEVTELLGLDSYVMPAAMVVYGYPTQQQVERRKPPRFAPRFIVQKNRYARQSEDELREMFAEREGCIMPNFDFDAYIRAFCARKYMSGFSLEMSRSAAEYLKKFS